MKKKQEQKKQNRVEPSAAPPAAATVDATAGSANTDWPFSASKLLLSAGVGLAILLTVVIYAQTLSTPAISYEDTFYLTSNPYVNVAAPLSQLDAVWKQHYFANFHPITTTTWLLDRLMADKSLPFDAHPFRVMHLVYLAGGAALLILLFRQVGITPLLAVLGAALFAAHPVKAEIGGWLSARKDEIVLIAAVLSFVSYLHARKAETVKSWWFWHALAAILNLVAVLSKPVAIILPALFVAWEFCSGGAAKSSVARLSVAHARALGLSAIMTVIGVPLALVLRASLMNQPTSSVLYIAVPIALALALLAAAPNASRLRGFLDGTESGLRVLGPPMVVHAVVFATAVAWTMWSQSAVGAVKSGFPILPTLNLSFEALLAYIGKTFVPLRLSASYVWTAYPAVSLEGVLGAAALLVLLVLAIRLSRHSDTNLRLVAFGILWFLIGFIPVSNILPTGTKMADRYLMLPLAGAIIAVCGACSWFAARRRPRQIAVAALLLAATGTYTAWSYQRAAVWCGTTTKWDGQPNPDLSIWTAAVEAHPDDFVAMTNLANVYLRMVPARTDEAIPLLLRALELCENVQISHSDGRILDATIMIEGLSQAYWQQAMSYGSAPGARDQKRNALREAVNYFELANQSPVEFPPLRAQFLKGMADANEELALLEPEPRRDALRAVSVQALEEAQRVLADARTSKEDVQYRSIILALGMQYLSREVGASPEERALWYRKALDAFGNAAALFPDDARAAMYIGICYQRLLLLAGSVEEKQRNYELAEAAFRKALTLRDTFPDYHPLMPYRGLATLHADIGDFRGALGFLTMVREKDPAYSRSSGIDREIQALERAIAR